MESALSHPTAPHLSHLSNSASPLGDLREPSTRQLLVSLITTLNASYPDYDFSDLRAEDFQREHSAQATINAVNVRRCAGAQAHVGEHCSCERLLTVLFSLAISVFRTCS